MGLEILNIKVGCLQTILYFYLYFPKTEQLAQSLKVWFYKFTWLSSRRESLCLSLPPLEDDTSEPTSDLESSINIG